jgi:REP element-mobilizing transposase RayT
MTRGNGSDIRSPLVTRLENPEHRDVFRITSQFHEARYAVPSPGAGGMKLLQPGAEAPGLTPPKIFRAPSGATPMPHSHICAVYHIVFSTKQRTQLIPADAQPRLWNYLAGIARNHGMRTFAVGGTENHVHILLTLPPDLAIADAVRTLKSNSSRFMRESSRLFGWQEGYGAFSVSPPQVAAVKNYIANQAAHHSRKNFEEEFAAMLRAANTGIAPEGAVSERCDR